MKTAAFSPSPVDERMLVMLRALANPARFRIVTFLAEVKDATSAQLEAVLPLAPSSLFEHVSRLREAGLVDASGDGPHRYYAINPSALRFVAGFLEHLGQQAQSWAGQCTALREGPGMTIRPAIFEDVAAIARIYNQGIEDRSATLETALRSEEERAAWLGARGPRHPVLVALNDNAHLMGWGSLNAFNARPVYDHVADFSVYVSREQRGRGVGDALLAALEDAARGLGYHKMVLAAFPTNVPGMRLYERHGFATVGTYHEQGMLDGHWVDVIVMEKVFA